MSCLNLDLSRLRDSERLRDNWEKSQKIPIDYRTSLQNGHSTIMKAGFSRENREIVQLIIVLRLKKGIVR